jgi:hypothetical protein
MVTHPWLLVGSTPEPPSRHIRARFLAAFHENDVRAPKDETLCRNMIHPATMPPSSNSSTS